MADRDDTKPIQIDVRLDPAPAPSQVSPALVVVGLRPRHPVAPDTRSTDPRWAARRSAPERGEEEETPPDPALMDVYEFRKRAQPGGQSSTIEVLTYHITHPDQLEGLPGLDQLDDDGRAAPSLIRDSVRLLLLNGMTEVMVLMIQMQGLKPWDFSSPAGEDAQDIAPILKGWLEKYKGAVLLFPDLGGPVSIGPGSEGTRTLEERQLQVVNAARLYGPAWETHYQICLLDVVTQPDAEWVPGVVTDDQWMKELLGFDLAVCRWTGDDRALKAHGWRSAAAAVAAILVSGLEAGIDGTLYIPVAQGATVLLDVGRDWPLSRDLELNRFSQSTTRIPAPQLVEIDIDPAGERARVEYDPTLRQPIGVWSLPALWTQKQIVRRIMEIAESFVFQYANEPSALKLQATLLDGLDEFIQAGVLTGIDGHGMPEIQTDWDPDRSAPKLLATIEALIRPWIVQVHITVGLSMQGLPEVKVK